MDYVLAVNSGPAMGDIRAMGVGDTLWLTGDAVSRPDWGRHLDAMSAAITRGADVRWVK